MEKSYIASIGRKSGGHKHKEIIQVILRKSFPQNKLEKVEKEYKEYQIAKGEADVRRMDKFQNNPEIYTPILSFTRYLANRSRKQRRERRYKKIQESTLTTSKVYCKFCIDNMDDAINSKLIHRQYNVYTIIRCGHSYKSMREGAKPMNQIGVSTLHQCVQEVPAKSRGLCIETQSTLWLKKELTSTSELTDNDVLYCTEAMQNRVIDIEKEVENHPFLVVGYRKRLLGYFVRTLKKMEKYILERGGKGIHV